MALALEFYIGDSERIAEAIRTIELDQLNDPAVVRGKADLSLHITPQDLNLLSLQMGRVSGRPAIELRPYLDPIVDEEDRGLLSVDSTWVAYAAAVRAEQVDDLVNGWFRAMRLEYGDLETVVTDESRLAVRDLIALCKAASEDRQPVVHAWFL